MDKGLLQNSESIHWATAPPGGAGTNGAGQGTTLPEVCKGSLIQFPHFPDRVGSIWLVYFRHYSYQSTRWRVGGHSPFRFSAFVVSSQLCMPWAHGKPDGLLNPRSLVGENNWSNEITLSNFFANRESVCCRSWGNTSFERQAIDGMETSLPEPKGRHRADAMLGYVPDCIPELWLVGDARLVSGSTHNPWRYIGPGKGLWVSVPLGTMGFVVVDLHNVRALCSWFSDWARCITKTSQPWKGPGGHSWWGLEGRKQRGVK
jgi:hypothetical protein